MDVSIIIINYNNAKLTLECIDSIYKHSSGYDFEVIVVDNGSKKDDVDFLGREIPKEVQLIKSKFNLGFGGGNMLGTQCASGKYLLYINNDTLFTQNCVLKLIKYMDENPSIGVTTTQQLDPKLNRRRCFDHFQGLRFHIFGGKFLESFYHKPNRDKHYDSPIMVDFIQGCFMFFRASAFFEVGGFDSNIFLYYEEMDICKRLKNQGFESTFYPNCEFIHIHEATTNEQISNFKKKEILISYLYVLRKNFGFLRFFFLKNLLTIEYFFKSILKPKKIEIFWSLLFLGSPLASSLKHKQTIKPS